MPTLSHLLSGFSKAKDVVRVVDAVDGSGGVKLFGETDQQKSAYTGTVRVVMRQMKDPPVPFGRYRRSIVHCDLKM